MFGFGAGGGIIPGRVIVGIAGCAPGCAGCMPGCVIGGGGGPWNCWNCGGTVARRHDAIRRGFVVVVHDDIGHDDLRLRPVVEGRRRCRAATRWWRAGRHDQNAIVGGSAHRSRSRLGDVAARGAKECFERSSFRHVVEFEADRRARQAFGTNDLRAADASPFVEDLTQRNVLRDDRHPTVGNRQAQIPGAGGRGRHAQKRKNRSDCECFHGQSTGKTKRLVYAYLTVGRALWLERPRIQLDWTRRRTRALTTVW